jgi:hypothetical protein
MSLISSVTSAAATLTAGLDPASTTSGKSPGSPTVAAAGLASARVLDALTAKLAGTTDAKAASTVKKATTVAKAGTTASKKTSAATGYAKAVAAGDDFAFLKDPTLSVEEKLFRFMCAIARRNDDEVLKKMEEMKGAAAKTAPGGSSGGSTTAKKSSGISVWNTLKALVPPLGMAAKLVGDAKLKSMITQVSGPVLAAAATALGMPALAPLALKVGPGLASAIMDGKLGGGEVASPAGSTSSSSSASGGSASSTPATGQNEQVQMMELQRLVDKQKEMFAMISNVLRAQHDTRMAIIGNVR